MTDPAPLGSLRFRRALKNRLLAGLCLCATLAACGLLLVLLFTIGKQGAPRLFSYDAAVAEELRAPVEPDGIADLAAVDWASVAERRGLAVLARLEDVDWDRVGKEQGLEWADQISEVDWAPLAARHELDPMALAAIDWAALYEELEIPGRGPILSRLMATGLGRFVTSPPSRHAVEAGIGPSLMGTVWICLICALVALPLGVGTAVFLEEYKPRSPLAQRLHSLVQLNIANLSGVPSIVYGILGLTAFVGMFGLFGNPLEPLLELGDPDSWLYLRLPFGRSVMAGGLTLMLVVLPIVIISSQEALRAVPDSLRQGALALGSTRWQMIRTMTLPAALPGIMTGSILAMSRAIGEAAPILVICGIVFIRFTPPNLMGDFTALPLQIYNWAGKPQSDFHQTAASGIIVLLVVLIAFNTLAILIRQKFQRPLQ